MGLGPRLKMVIDRLDLSQKLQLSNGFRLRNTVGPIAEQIEKDTVKEEISFVYSLIDYLTDTFFRYS
jgi:hypothetical protein